jgi:hypothetical protein
VHLEFIVILAVFDYYLDSILAKLNKGYSLETLNITNLHESCTLLYRNRQYKRTAPHQHKEQMRRSKNFI